MPGPFWLPEDVAEGDHIEIGMLGAYGVAMATRFNGFGDVETVEVDDAPMASHVRPGRPLDPEPPRSDETKVVKVVASPA